MKENHSKVDKATVIHIQNKMYKVAESELTGSEILALSHKTDTEYELYLLHGKEKQKVRSEEKVSLKNGLHFFVVLKDIKFG